MIDNPGMFGRPEGCVCACWDSGVCVVRMLVYARVGSHVVTGSSHAGVPVLQVHMFSLAAVQACGCLVSKVEGLWCYDERSWPGCQLFACTACYGATTESCCCSYPTISSVCVVVSRACEQLAV